MADDFKWTASGANAINLLMLVLFFWSIVGLPFSWAKFHGGTELEYVGYWLDYSKFAAVMSDKRTEWIKKSLHTLLDQKMTVVRDLEAQLGRWSFAFLALSHLRPFLGPSTRGSRSVRAGRT